jgi:hypothetical protein
MRAEFEVESAVVQVLENSAPDLRMVWESRDRVSQSRVALHDSWANTLANPRFRRPRQRITDVQISSDQRLSDYTAQDRSVLREGLRDADWASHSGSVSGSTLRVISR